MDEGVLYGFLDWFKDFFGHMLGGLLEIFKGLFYGIIHIFDFPYYFKLWSQNGASMGFFDWVLSILFFLLSLALWAAVIFLIVLGVRKYIRFRRTLIGNEDLLEEIADLHRDVVRLNNEKEKIMQIKVQQAGITYDELKTVIDGNEEEVKEKKNNASDPVAASVSRFARLSAVDNKYLIDYVPPEYNDQMSLSQICDDLRNFACYNSKLYYDPKTIRLMLAGFAATKLIILQGISGTGKTSLPYIMGKYFLSDATIAAVQPSWRDRNELFGYFNEFTKKFNETEVLRRIYESGYNDDINIIVLDEMNISRVEYYFAEMLSILEMPDPKEWKLELVPSVWDNDPKRLDGGNLQIPQHVFYVGTINNDDSTFSVSDKVYDRALVINLNSKGIPFDSPVTISKRVSYSHVSALFEKAIAENPVSAENLEKINQLDLYVIQRFRVAFGNRIVKQLKRFVPAFAACGGDELEAIDYMLATKVFRKFESLNLSLIRDEIRGLINFMDNLFGKGKMKESEEYLLRLQKTY